MSMDQRPTGLPIGMQLDQVARAASRAFDDALAAEGGSRPVWLIMISLKRNPHANQREIAGNLGLQGATVTHHLNAMEADGLLTRERDTANRRAHVITLTDEGNAVFHRLAKAAMVFDTKLRAGISADEIATLADLLTRLGTNVARDQSVET
jgi:MarR family transcriptional regulator for hemolysin